uniref:Polyphenol oxidase 2 n=1 Tax=Lilium hybrid cultivar TaxID=156531 RepID=A0A173DSH2_9LILI|nr:polyphenol oxidase 2 [Lilium hybrid cultivar]
MASLLSSSFSFTSRALHKGSLKKSQPRTTVSCKANSEHNKIDRRDVLLGLGGLYGLGTTLPALSLPIQAPDISQCGPATLPAGAKPLNCCPPYTSTIIDYKLPSPTAPLRVRPIAHTADPEYIAKYTKAVELMRALPDDDPRSFNQQAKVHCAYCDGAYDQVGFDDLELQIHFSWLFFPWHRFYLHFHERILGKLIGDDSFALPFWSWDVPAGMTLPLMYTNSASALYDKLRDAKHQPPTLVDLDFNGVDPTYTAAQQIDHNLKIMYRQVISNGKTASLFMGATYRAGDQPSPGPGSFENVPHGPVHVWTGDRNQPNGEDMGALYSAAFDPIFFAHHANIDRIWDVWLSLGGKHANFTDKDWLDTSFVFYDENAQLVKVKISDCLSTSKMRYTYQNIDVPWLTTRPTPLAKKTTLLSKKAVTADTTTTAVVFPVLLDKPVTVTVKRERVSRSADEKEKEEEVLVVEGIEVEKGVYTKFDVYVNGPAEGVTPAASEFAGSFVSVPHRHQHSGKLKTTLKLGITDLLEDLQAEGDESIVVTLVPRSGKGKVKIGGISFEFAS